MTGWLRTACRDAAEQLPGNVRACSRTGPESASEKTSSSGGTTVDIKFGDGASA